MSEIEINKNPDLLFNKIERRFGEVHFDNFNLPNDQIVLGCLNQSFKLDPIFFDIWINILEK